MPYIERFKWWCIFEFMESIRNDTNALRFKMSKFKSKYIFSSGDLLWNVNNNNKSILVLTNRYTALDNKSDKTNNIETHQTEQNINMETDQIKTKLPPPFSSKDYKLCHILYKTNLFNRYWQLFKLITISWKYKL